MDFVQKFAPWRLYILINHLHLDPRIRGVVAEVLEMK